MSRASERSRDRDDRDDDRGRGRDRDDDRRSSRDRDDRGSRDRDRDDDRRGGRERGDRDGRSRDRDARSSSRGPKGGGSARRGASYRNPENVRRRTEQTAGNFDTIFKSGIEQWYPKPGENAVRILPATWPDAEHYGYDVFVHSYIGSSGSTYICPNKTFGKPCAACDEAKELKAAGEEEASKAMAAKKKTIVYLLDRDERKPTPRVWVMSWNQDKEIQDNAIIKRTNTTLFLDDEDKGWDLFIKRTGKGLNTRYSYVVDRDPSPIDEDPRTQDEILAYIDENPIPDLLKYADNETIAKALDGGTRERDRDLDDRDDDRRGSRGRGSRDRDDRDRDDRGRDRDDDRRGGRERGDRDGRSRDRDARSSSRGPKGGGSARRGASYRNPENVRRRTEQTAGNFDTIFKSGIEQWYPKPGENAVRILPATWPDAEHYGYDVFVHSYIGSSGSTYICPNKTFGKPCAACDEAKELKAAGEEEASKAMAAKKKTIVYLLDRDERKPTPRVWVMSWNQDKEIQDNAIIKRTNTTLFLDDEDKGWDLFIKRTGKGLNTRYSYVVDRDPSPIDEDPRTQDEILAYIDENPIPDLLKYADNETIAKALDGGTRERDRDLDDRDDDRRGSRGRGSRDRDDRDRDDRGRDRDEDDRSPPRRGRDRDEDDRDSDRNERVGRSRSYDDEEDTRSTRGDRLSGRGRDEERPRGRGRDDDGEEGNDRPRSRGRDEEDDRPRGRDRDEERGGRDRDEERGRDRDEDRPRSRREPEDDERPSRRDRDREDERDDERPRRR